MGSLEPGLQRFIDEQIASGRHANADEVREAALRYYRYVLEEHYKVVRREVERGIAAIEAGDFVEIESPEQLSALIQHDLDDAEAADYEDAPNADQEA